MAALTTTSSPVADSTDFTGANRNLFLYIQHIPSNEIVEFKALIKEFSDSFQSSWNSEEVYGRMDPIETFQGTKRTIKLSWDVVSFDLDEAQTNLTKMDLLTNFLYPTYDSVSGGATTITSSPLLRMKLANLITQPGDPGTDVRESGLVGRMDGFSYTPDFDSGVFMGPGKNPKLFPQTINVSCTFYVLHTHKLGWRRALGDKEFTSKEGFPHNMNPGTEKFTGTPRGEAGAEAVSGEMASDPAVETGIIEIRPARPV
tara:strand:+ start:73 stop:846 length:774 start_codon:yes stop_codon:yes gene_type:complete